MEERTLIERLMNGDNHAADILIERHKSALFAFIMRMLGDHDTAEDVFQETWIRAIKSIKSFRGKSKFSTWLISIAMNRCRDVLRAKGRRTFEPIEDYADTLGKDPSVDPYKLLAAERVRNMLEDLPLKMKEVMVLRYYHDLSDDEIAKISGCPVGTVRSRIHRASALFRKKWDHAESNHMRG